MDYSTLLLEFMDGTLEGANELALFNALSSNEELRSEFKHLLAISASVRTDLTPFIPPTASTNHIFSELGFTAPLPAPGPIAAAAAAGAGRPAVWSMRRFFPAVASAVLASLTTAAVLMWLGGSQPAALNGVAHAPRTASLERIVAHNTGGSGTTTGATEAQAQNTPVREVVRYVYIPQPNTPSEGTNRAEVAAPTENTAAIVQAPETILHSNTLAAQFGTDNIADTDGQYPEMMSTPTMSTTSWWTSTPSVLTAELRDNVSISFPSATTDPASTSWWNNKSLSIFYALSDRQSVGLEFGQEPFFQRFEARNPAGRRYQYEQTPVLQWAGVAYRFSISEIGAFNPFGQVVIGGTRVGYLGKTMVGVNYMPTPSLRLTAGIEGSLLYYPVQGSLYRSGKLGITYGIGFTL